MSDAFEQVHLGSHPHTLFGSMLTTLVSAQVCLLMQDEVFKHICVCVCVCVRALCASE